LNHPTGAFRGEWLGWAAVTLDRDFLGKSHCNYLIYSYMRPQGHSQTESQEHEAMTKGAEDCALAAS